MRLAIPYFVSAMGAILLLSAFARDSGTSLPYPDPTAELLAEQKRQLQSATLLAQVGAVLLVAGLVSHRILVRAQRRSARRD